MNWQPSDVKPWPAIILFPISQCVTVRLPSPQAFPLFPTIKTIRNWQRSVHRMHWLVIIPLLSGKGQTLVYLAHNTLLWTVWMTEVLPQEEDHAFLLFFQKKQAFFCVLFWTLKWQSSRQVDPTFPLSTTSSLQTFFPICWLRLHQDAWIVVYVKNFWVQHCGIAS